MYLNESERMVMRHQIERVAAEIRWHEELIARLPKIAADFREGVGGPHFGEFGTTAQPGTTSQPREQT
jgi:hypothetical protein